MQDEKDKKPYDRFNSTRRTIRFDDDLLEQINSVIGDEPFSSWVKTACRKELERLGIEPKDWPKYLGEWTRRNFVPTDFIDKNGLWAESDLAFLARPKDLGAAFPR